MATVRLAERAPLPAPSQTIHEYIDYSLTEVSFVLHDLSWTSTDDAQDGCVSKVTYTNRRMCITDDVLDNETEYNANHFKLFDDFTTGLRNFNYASLRARRADPDDSGVDMENGNPLDDVNDSDLLENEVMVDPWSSMDSSNSPLSESIPSASDECPPPAPPAAPAVAPRTAADAARARGLTLPLQAVAPAPSRRPHFLDDDDTHRSSNIDCRIPKPHFLDHSPSPDEFDERSDITNPNFLDDDADEDPTHKKSGALPKKPERTPTYLPEDRPHPTSYRSTLHFGLSNAARSSERDKRASQLYRGTWPGERDVWTGHDAASVKSYSSNGSAESTRPSSNLDNKMECVCSLISLLSLSPENNADLSGPLLEMSRSVESCIAMRQAGCIPLLVQLIHSKVSRDIRDRAAKALRNIIYTQTDDKAGRREARVWRLLEQVREYCYILEDIAHNKKEEKETIEDDGAKHPSQSVAALMKLSFDEEHRHVVCQLGGLQALAALVSGDQAAHGSRADDSTCLTMRKYAGMTLTNLTFGDGNNKSLLCSFKDFMLALVEQLESPNDDMRQVTAAVLRNLSWRADSSSKQVLREVGAVKGLTKAAMTCQKEATLKSVLSALWNLTAHCSMNKVALCSVDGALGFLVDMLSYDSPTKTLAIVENAGGIMRNVSSHIAVREDYRQILRERNCLSVLLQHLKSPSLTVVSNSCGTLWNLSARCPADQQFLWDHGAVPMLRSLIHSKHKMIAMGSGAALKNLLNSKPGKTHIVSLDSTARNMNLPALPTLGARKQKTLEQELDQNLAETCDNIEPATSPTTSNREEKNLFTATERQIAMNLERHRMTSSSPLMGALASQISLSHSAHLASYLSCSNTLLKGALVTRSTQGSSNNVNRSDSKDSVTSAQSDTVFEKVMRTGKVPVPTPRNKDLLKCDVGSDRLNTVSKTGPRDGLQKFPVTPPVPPPRTTEMRTNFAESGYDVDQDSCDQPIDFSRKYSETKTEVDPGLTLEKPKSQVRKYKKDSPPTFGDYQETDLDQPTDYSLRYAEHPSEHSDAEPLGPSVHEDSIKHFATEGTPYETPLIFSTATSMSDLRILGKDEKPKSTQSVKENPEAMTHSDEKDTCSIEDPPHDNDMVLTTPQNPEPEKPSLFDTKFSSGMISPEKPVNYCDEGTPGYFSRVSSLSSLGEPTEEDCLAKKNAMATIAVEPSALDNAATSKDKDGSKAVTFAACDEGRAGSPGGSGVQDTPLMFSRTSSLGSLPSAADRDHDPGSHSELSRLTSGCISPSEIPDSPGAPVSPPPEPGEEAPRFLTHSPPAGEPQPSQLGLASPSARADLPQGTQTPGDSCRVYLTEDTPAGLSKAGSRSDLSALSLDSEQLQVAKHEDPSPDISLLNYDREDVYRSLPPYLRTSTETVKMSQELNRNLRDSASPPPLPPKDARVAAPPRPPRASRRHESRQSTKAQRNRQDSVHNDSSSSLSLDSFGSTDREIFEETVQAGLRGAGGGSGGGGGAGAGRAPRPRSLDRSWRRARRLDRSSSLSSLSNDSFGSTDKEVFERCVRAGMPRAERSPARRAAPRRERRAARSQGALDRMRGRHDRDRALLEQLIASAAQHKAKNAAAPPAPRAPAGGAAPAPPPAPELPDLLVACPPHPAPLARRAIALEAARLAARLAALPPPSLLEHVAPPADLDHSLLSVCSLSSDGAPLPALDLERSAVDFPLCHSFELLDLDKVEPPSLLAELTESADLPEPCAAPAPTIDPTDVEIVTNDRREHKPLTPKEKRNLAKDRYQTYTIIDPPAAPDADGGPVRTRTTAKQRRLEDRARYQTQTVDIHTIIQQTKAADPEIEDLKRRLAAKKTIKQKRQEDVERYRTRTLSDDVPPSPPRADCGSGLRAPGARTPDVLDICTRNNIKNILMTESYQRALQTEKQTNPSTSHVASSGGDSNSEKGQSESDEEALPRPKPKITIPERSDERPISSDGQEKEDAKIVRGRKKAAYVSPYRRSVPPAKKPTAATGAIPKPPTRDVSTAKGQTSAKTTTKTPPRPLSATSSPKKTLTKSPIKTKLQAPQTAASPVIPVKPLPLERQGTFTKEESSVPTKDLPVPEKKATPNKYAKNVNGKSIPVASTSPSRLATWNRGGKPAARAGAPTARGAPAPAPAPAPAAAAAAPRGPPSATPAARSRQGSTSSLNSVNSSKTPTKDVESKIASLWKRVEQCKKGPTKPDKRIWIEGDKTEPSKLIRSSTFEGQPKQIQVSSAPKQKTTIGIKVSQIPSLRPKSTPSKINTTPVKKLAPPRVFARKPANGLAA